MAIAMSVDLIALAAGLGVDYQYIVKLKDAGVVGKKTQSKLLITKGGEVLATVGIPAAAVNSVLSNTITAPLAKSYAKVFEQAVHTLDFDVLAAESEAAPALMAVGGNIPFKAMKALKAIDAADPLSVGLDLASEPAKLIASVVWPVFPKEKMATGPTVKLRDAHQLYQPVDGTSHGSRYFLVAGHPDLRVAARWKAAPSCGGMLSVRVEGPSLSKHMPQIAAAGFDVPSSSSVEYVSLHLSCDGETVAARALGSLISGIDLEWRTLSPAFSVFKGCGK